MCEFSGKAQNRVCGGKQVELSLTVQDKEPQILPPFGRRDLPLAFFACEGCCYFHQPNVAYENEWGSCRVGDLLYPE